VRGEKPVDDLDAHHRTPTLTCKVCPYFVEGIKVPEGHVEARPDKCTYEVRESCEQDTVHMNVHGDFSLMQQPVISCNPKLALAHNENFGDAEDGR